MLIFHTWDRYLTHRTAKLSIRKKFRFHYHATGVTAVNGLSWLPRYILAEAMANEIFYRSIINIWLIYSYQNCPLIVVNLCLLCFLKVDRIWFTSQQRNAITEIIFHLVARKKRLLSIYNDTTQPPTLPHHHFVFLSTEEIKWNFLCEGSEATIFLPLYFFLLFQIMRDLSFCL